MSIRRIHPASAFAYFVAVLGLSMFTFHPLITVLFALSGAILTACLRAYTRRDGWWLLPLFLVAVTNPLFSHHGATVLFYFNANPVTLESLYYGIQLSVLLAGVLLWFRALRAVLTEDKTLFLFGRIAPKTALLLSAALRMIPLLTRQWHKLRLAQQSLGVKPDNLPDRIRLTAKRLSALITWALEYAIETGAAMRSRGYGLRGRTCFSVFRFTPADGAHLALTAVLSAVIICALAAGRLNFTFYPRITYPAADALTAAGLACYGLLCFFPVLYEGKEAAQWRYTGSGI